MKTYINEYKANKALCSALFQLIMEDKESNAMKAVVRYLEQRLGLRERAKETFNALRNDIPSIRLPLYTNENGREKGTYKFGIGVARMFLNGELSDGQKILDFNKSLELLAQAHANEYDNNLNGKTVEEINDIFGTIKAYELYRDKQLVASEQYTPKGYTVVKIPDAYTAHKYSRYVSWCVTESNLHYNSYTGDGFGVFYFFLKDGYQNVKRISGDTTPFDEYGLSMIAVSVSYDGSLNTITSRWNNGDHIMNALQLSRVVGMNVYDVCKPLSRDELRARGKILCKDVQEMLDNGADPKSIFSDLREHSNYWQVCLNRKWNYYIPSTNKIMFSTWYDNLGEIKNGYICARLNNKSFYIDIDGNNVFNKTFDSAQAFNDGFAVVMQNHRCYYIDKNGNNAFGKTFYNAKPFSNGFGLVRLAKLDYCYIDKNGNNAFGKTFRDAKSFSDGIAMVRPSTNDEFYFLSKNGKLLIPSTLNNGYCEINGHKVNKTGQLLDRIYNETDGYRLARLAASGLYYFMDTNGNNAFGKTFRGAEPFSEGFAVVQDVKSNEYYYINKRGMDVFGKKFIRAFPFKNGVAQVRSPFGRETLDINGDNELRRLVKKLKLKCIPKKLATESVELYYSELGIRDMEIIRKLDPTLNAYKILDQCLYDNKVYFNPNNSTQNIADAVEREFSMNIAELAKTNLEFYQRIKYKKYNMLVFIEQLINCLMPSLIPRKNPRLRR